MASGDLTKKLNTFICASTVDMLDEYREELSFYGVDLSRGEAAKKLFQIGLDLEHVIDMKASRVTRKTEMVFLWINQKTLDILDGLSESLGIHNRTLVVEELIRNGFKEYKRRSLVA